MAHEPAGRYPNLRVRPRVIVTTDGEVDDRCSMVRFLMFANEFQIEGLIHSSSRFHWLGQTWSGVVWINGQIDQYGRVYVGSITNVGEMERDTPGADRIVQVLLDDQPGPVYLPAWGCTNTIAKALLTIQKDYPAQVEKVTRKAVVYIILDQDDTFRKYIEPNWPKLQVLGSFRQFAVLAHNHSGVQSGGRRGRWEHHGSNRSRHQFAGEYRSARRQGRARRPVVLRLDQDRPTGQDDLSGDYLLLGR